MPTPFCGSGAPLEFLFVEPLDFTDYVHGPSCLCGEGVCGWVGRGRGGGEGGMQEGVRHEEECRTLLRALLPGKPASRTARQIAFLVSVRGLHKAVVWCWSPSKRSGVDHHNRSRRMRRGGRPRCQMRHTQKPLSGPALPRQLYDGAACVYMLAVDFVCVLWSDSDGQGKMLHHPPRSTSRLRHHSSISLSTTGTNAGCSTSTLEGQGRRLSRRAAF